MKGSIKLILLVFVCYRACAFRDIPLPSLNLLNMPTEAEVLAEVFALDAAAATIEQDMLHTQVPASTPAEPDWQDQAVASNWETQTQPWVEQISREPRAYIHHNFLSSEEADHIIQLAQPNLVKSKTVLGETGIVTTNPVRTSSGAWIQRSQDQLIKTIEERIANWTGSPVENAEPLHVLRYQKDEEYKAHYDFYFDEVNTINGGQRVATVLLYLTDVEEGGETVFPLSLEKASAQDAKNFSMCAQQGVAAKARRGDALLFFSVLPDGETMDERSLHAGCPVVKGEKWLATKWLRAYEWIDAPLSQLEAVKKERELMRLQELRARIAAYKAV